MAINQVHPRERASGPFPAAEARRPPGKMQPQDAIVVKNAYKRYSKNSPPILDGLNMRVPAGCIYGLLGASGCGKTTLLSCVVGVRKLDRGELWVLGGKPGEKGSGIPGPRVGYMPQEISLVNEFSVIGALYYFGRINGLDDSVIDERYAFFSELLQLPPKDRLIKDMSGGQQRRVSFAASLVHRPELLILDEPTVGLDPILRDNIWNYLVKIAREQGIAIIITTHYIEEAKQANRVGLLRCGQLLADTTPSALLTKFQCPTLEEAFLILSQRQNDNQSKGIHEVAEVSEDLDQVTTNSIPSSQIDLRSSTDCIMSSEKQLLDKQFGKKCPTLFSPNTGRIFRALMTKNLLQFLRHPGGILFAFVFPMVQVTLFFYAVGRDPKGLVVGVVNDEAGNCNYGNNRGSVIFDPDTGACDYINISCRFLDGFDESIMKKRYFDNVENATAAVRNGDSVGTMYFGKNFSLALQNRRDNLNEATEEEIVEGEIITSLDMGDRQIGLFLQKSLLQRFIQIHGEIVSACNISKKFVQFPVQFEEPIFGGLNDTYTDFVAPGFILTITFFLATAVSSSIIIADRAEGVWDRSLVQGVSTTAILFSHILTQILMIIIQVTVVMCISFGHFELSCKGSLSAVVVLVVLTGVCGMCYGFLISVFCNTHTMANFMSTGSFYPIILLCASNLLLLIAFIFIRMKKITRSYEKIYDPEFPPSRAITRAVWPLEGMPKFLMWVSMSLPTTIPAVSMRGILAKASTMDDPEVYSGFLIVAGWTLAFIVACIFGLRGRPSC